MATRAERERERNKIAEAVNKSRKAFMQRLAESVQSVSRADLAKTSLSFLAEHKVGVGMAILISFAVTKSSDNPFVVWPSMAILWFLFASALKESSKIVPVKFGGTLALAGGCFIFGWWLTDPPLIDVVFKNPDQIGLWTRYQVRRTITHFNIYLREFQFDPPLLIPPIGVGNESYTAAGPRSTITLAPNVIRDNREIVWNYSLAVFVPTIMKGSVALSERSKQRAVIARIYAAYFASDYENEMAKAPIVQDPFFQSLWELRSRLGPSVVGHSLIYAIDQIVREGVDDSTSPDLDSYFGRAIGGGLLEMSTDVVADQKILEGILQNHGVHVKVPGVTFEYNVPIK